MPTIKQYRDQDGLFYFKLLGGDGRLLVQSAGHESARTAGQLIAKFKGAAARELRHPGQRTLQLDDAPLGEMAEGVSLLDIQDVLVRFAAAAAEG